MNLGKNLRKLLEQYAITQKELAHKLDITPSAMGNYVQNTREPDYDTLIKIADFFHVTTDFLLGHPAGNKLTHEEELLLNTFRSLTNEQKEFYLEQGKIFIHQNNKKILSHSNTEKTKTG